MKKLTEKEIKEYVNSRNYEFISCSYEGRYWKLKMKCDNGHLIETSLDSFKYSNANCRYCYFNRRKTDIKNVHEIVSKTSYELISHEYERGSLYIIVKCDKDHKYKVRWDEFQSGHTCKKCESEKRKKVFFEKIKKFIENENHKLLSTEYKNSHSKIKLKCPEGHEFDISWDMFRLGQRCPTCWILSLYGENNPAWKGGITYDEYCQIWFNKEFKNLIKDRDNHNCLNPYCNKKSRKLCVHHIDYDKKNCLESNLITVCMSCNSSANKDREWHTAWYQAIMNKRYNYKY